MTGNRYFEDFRVGETYKHATPRTVHGGDLSLYIGLTGDARALPSSTEMAQSLGFERELVHELMVFHIVFGKTVDDISANAVANLGYADVQFLEPVYPGDTLRAESEVIGVRQTSSGTSGIVWVTTRGINQRHQEVLRYCRWVLVEKRDPKAPAPTPTVPTLAAAVEPGQIPIPSALNLSRFEDVEWATGGSRYWDDYQVGQSVPHPGGMTINDSDHSLATRLYQNTARVHFDGHRMSGSRFGKRLVYGGHVISVAHALARRGLENVLWMAAWNGGTHANPVFAGDTVYAWTEILECAEIPGRLDLGALRMRLLAVTNEDPMESPISPKVSTSKGESYDKRVVLDLDWWGLLPRRPQAT